MPFGTVTDLIDALNLINSSRINELYKSRDVEDPLILRKKAADFRKGYKNWRQKKPKGARGETNYLLEHEKQRASAFTNEAMQFITEAQAEVTKFTELHGATMFEGAEYAIGESVTPKAGMVRTKSFNEMDGELPHHIDEKENWLKFYVNPYSGMAEASAKEPVELTQAALKILPSSVLKPKFNRPKGKEYVDRYICHLGVGGFHRSHQCVYTDDLLNIQALSTAPTGDRWGFCGIGLMDWDRKMYEILRDQDYLYTVLSRGHQMHEARIIGSIVDFIFAPDDHQKCIDKMADPKTCIVSLTVTEKGYCQNNKGDLDLNNAFVKSDLETNLAKPKTAIGMIVAALRQRRANKIVSFTVLSCDNLPENGEKAKHCVLQMAELIDPTLKIWITENTTFPNTMVDRITPVTDQEHKDILARDHMIVDNWPVIAEDFSQWVIENQFSCGAPNWHQVGALLVDDVRPYEFMKLRLLNGGHSALSYVGYLCGYHYVDDAMSDPMISKYVSAYFEEICPTLSPVPGVHTPEYCLKLIDRFSNPYIKDKLLRLAEDGSKKMQNTMRDAIVDLQKRGLSTRILSLANAAWIRYCTGVNEEGDSYDISDPLASTLKELAQAACQDPDKPNPRAFLLEIHGPELVACDGFVNEVIEHLQSLMSVGAKNTLSAVINSVTVM